MGTTMPANRIRSGYQRRILDELLEGPSTVSELAQRIGLATSHTSSTLRVLREQGLVHRDEALGIRGAAHHLTEEGQARLEADAIDRLRQALKVPTERTAPHLLLSREDSLVVVAYDGKPEAQLIHLPPRNINGPNPALEGSSGNMRGGAWCLLRGPPVWLNRSDLSRTLPPREGLGPGSILTWSEDERPIALVRGRILDGGPTWTMPPGAWFDLHDASDVPAPQMLREGTVELGRVQGTSVTCKPTTPVLGMLRDAWRRERTLREGDGVSIARSSRPAELPRRPVGLLSVWLRRKHPRLDVTELERRGKDLLRRLQAGLGRRRTALERAALTDFGPSTWIAGDVDHLELARTSDAGVRAIWNWVMLECNQPFRGEWTLGTSDRKLLHQVVENERCDLLVAADNRLAGIEASSKIHSEGTSHVLTLRGRHRFLLAPDERTSSQVHPMWGGPLPKDARALMGMPLEPQNLSPSRSDLTSEVEALRLALGAWPDGNDELADRCELNHPLAAWVASSPSERARRWPRIGARLPPGWLELLQPEEATSTWLATEADHADRAYRQASALVLARRMNGEEAARAAWSNAPGSIASCARLLSLRPAASAEPEDLNAWMRDPLHLEAVLPMVHASTAKSLAEEGVVAPRPLQSWFGWWQHQHQVLEIDVIMRCCVDLPLHWWAPWAFAWLPRLAATARGRRWLATTDVPWPVVASLAESGGAPGITAERAARGTSETLVDLHLVEEGPGQSSVQDLLEGLMAAEEGRPPPLGKTHLQACWLLMPSSTWPPYVGIEETQEAVGRELHRRRLQIQQT